MPVRLKKTRQNKQLEPRFDRIGLPATRTKTLHKLDLRGLKCPLPVLKTRKFLSSLAPGEKVEVACTDPLSAIDLPNLLRETGDALEASSKSDGALLFLIRKGAAA